jgi:hypothetical protein
MPTEKITIDNIDAARFARLQATKEAKGLKLTGNDGEVHDFGADVVWNYAASTETLTLIVEARTPLEELRRLLHATQILGRSGSVMAGREVFAELLANPGTDPHLRRAVKVHAIHRACDRPQTILGTSNAYRSGPYRQRDVRPASYPSSCLPPRVR